MEINISKYHIGALDEDGEIISYVFSMVSDEYVIYFVKNRLLPKITGTVEYLNKLEDIAPQIANIRAINFQKKFVGLQIAHAIKIALENCPTEALVILNNVEKKVLYIKELSGKLSYMLGSLMLLMNNLLVSLLLIFKYESNIPHIEKRVIFIWFVATFGSLGGFLSISINLKNYLVDYEAGILINMLAGVTRILISMIASIFILMVIKSNLLLGIIGESSHYAVFAFAILAGFSESFVPNTLKKLETSNEKISI